MICLSCITSRKGYIKPQNINRRERSQNILLRVKKRTIAWYLLGYVIKAVFRTVLNANGQLMYESGNLDSYERIHFLNWKEEDNLVIKVEDGV